MKNFPGTYVAAKLDKEIAEQIASGLPHLQVEADKLHCTIMYDTESEYDEHLGGHEYYLASLEPIKMAVSGVTVFDCHDGTKALVLLLAPVSAVSLNHAHEYLSDVAKYRHSYADYKPHVTLKYGVDAETANTFITSFSTDILGKIVPNDLEFSEIYHEPLDPNWN